MVPLGSEQITRDLRLGNGSRVAVVGCGPAGSFFSHFLLELTEQVRINVRVDVYESRDFSCPAPLGCNMCGGIISESLVQALAEEGISLPPTVVQRGIDSYVLHTDAGDVKIETPLHEMRIAAVFRGPGPRDMKEGGWSSFDGFLQKLVLEKGVNLIRERVDEFTWEGDRPRLKTRGGSHETYDLIAVAAGVNSGVLRLFQEAGCGYRAPHTTRTFIGEYRLGAEAVGRLLGSSMHVFLLNIPRLEFAAIIPKGDYATLCLLGEEIDHALVRSFLECPVVRRCLPPESYSGHSSCNCWPHINVRGATRPYSDRIVFIGDSAFTRLYKDGIGAAYRTGKAAAATAVLHGISAADFEEHYWPVCRGIGSDNAIGRLTFVIARLIQKSNLARRAVLRMVAREQKRRGQRRRMSMVLWDMFTGSASYRDIFLRAFHPGFLGRFVWNVIASVGRAR